MLQLGQPVAKSANMGLSSRIVLSVKRQFAQLDRGCLIAALLPLIGILPTIGDGVIRAADAPLHVHRIFAMTTLLQQGSLWPRWVSWFHLGYGYPIFNFYPPGVFYLGGLLGLIGITATIAFTFISALAWIIGSVGMYALARKLLSGYAALLAAALWSYAPSRLYEIWFQGSLPQMIAAALIPWLFCGLISAAKKPTPRNIIGVAVPFAGMLLTHQPMTFLTGLVIVPAVITLPLIYSKWTGTFLLRRWIGLITGLLLGAGLAAIFLLPLATELRYVRSSQQAADVIPYLKSNFLTLNQLFMQPPPVDLTDLRTDLPTTFGLIGGIFTAFGLTALVRRKQFLAALLLAAVSAFIIFMLLDISLPLWEHIPFLAQLRFPARWLRVGTVFIGLAGGASLLWLPERWRPAGAVIGIVVVIMAAMPTLYPTQPFVNWPALSALDEIQMESTDHNWGTTSYDEFRPNWGQKPGWDQAVEPEEYIANPLRIVVNRLDMARQGDLKVEQLTPSTVRVTIPTPRPVRFRQFYYPGWTAKLDGQTADIYPEDELGQITLDVPAGKHIISLSYTGTPIQTIGALITLASIAVAIVLYFLQTKPSSPDAVNEQVSKEMLSPRFVWGISSGIVAFAALNTFYIAPQTTWFRQRSAPDAPAYMQTAVHESFGGVFELLGYTLDKETVSASQPLNITLFWRAQHPIDRDYRPIVQIVNLSQSAAWAASEPFFPGGGRTALGYSLNRFASEVHALSLFEHVPPYVGRISVQMVESRTGDPLILTNGKNRLLLSPLIQIHGDEPDIPQTLNFHLGDAIELWCAAVQHNDNQFNIRLGWHVSDKPNNDFVVFAHGLDTNGNMIKQNDAPPLGQDYPTSLWRGGQNLVSDLTLPFDPAIQSIALGLYQPDNGNARLNITHNSQPVSDNRILLPLSESSCLP
jgi:hypothetical protein